MSAYEAERVAKADGTYEALTSIVKDACVFRINNQSSVHQSVSVEKFSTLIDQGQAMFNLSVFLGLTHSDEKDSIVMFLHFSESEGSIEINKSAKSQFFFSHCHSLGVFECSLSLSVDITGSSISRTHSLSRLIPVNTRHLTVWFSCSVFSGEDQFCIFDQVKLSVFQKTL